MTLEQWAVNWRIDPRAMQELRMRLGAWGSPGQTDGSSEKVVEAQLRLEASRRGDIILFRNNVGALLDTRGVPVRYGLANESAQANKIIKSADWIGIYRRLIRQADVGQHIGQLVSVEAKRLGWTYTGAGRETAQMNWGATVAAYGGYARFYAGGALPAFHDLPHGLNKNES